MDNNKLIVFDLDGTLNRTELYAVPAHLKALKEYGITDKTEEFILSTFGQRAQEYVQLLLPNPDEETARAYLNKVSLYEQEFMQKKCRTFDGVPEVLEKLRASGYITAVCSNASFRYINLVLTSLKLSDQIDFIQPLLPDMTKVDTLGFLLDKVNPNKAVMVGDRIFDLEAAKGNRIPFIGCLYGFNPQEVQSADRTVNSAAEIFDAVVELIG